MTSQEYREREPLTPVEHMKQHLATYVRAWEQLEEKDAPFTGPDLYFHLRTLEQRRQLGDPNRVIADRRYFEYLYATLTAWGLHRSGKRGPKLADFESFRRNAAALFGSVSKLFARDLIDVDEHESEDMADSLPVPAVAGKKGLAKTKPRLVVNSKALHHFLPGLVPPVDRRFVLGYLGQPDSGSGEEREGVAFKYVFRSYHEIIHSGSNAEVIRSAICRGSKGSGLVGWHSSTTKVVDNAVMARVILSQQRGRE